MNNTRFATSVHILTLLALKPEEWLSSEFIAGSININPVIVRKEIIFLSGAGLIQTKKGKDGGAKLNRPASLIYLSEILEIVHYSDMLGRKNLNTNPQCFIGSQINERLDSLFKRTDLLIKESLGKQSLADFLNQF
ncbi:BadM/Rrf2 family transcriptional regulator [Sphingobacterium alimentarium]|uniref:BadM/Rrf2 family transcriptional regulator n=1 Tax=Sphingobacterium alimentarium TaxID=797292 RepID=A0A4R3VVI9_9SPHI|nr:Rrf2 family transcriptional regulator [Sphingobacterium alimentarium]TCV09903.1 BadM/Rrf2 family transcriptional regulator [Sphingobacterium alimentarium]